MSIPALNTGEKPVTIFEYLKSQNTQDRMKKVLPAHMNASRMLSVLANAVRSTPKLAECDVKSLLGAMMACSSLGLEPNTPLGECYLIPFDKNRKVGTEWIKTTEVQLIIGYKGYMMLARRTGTIKNIHADVVYEGDEFSFEYGSNQHLRHVPKGTHSRKPLFAYCHATLTDGEAFEVLPIEEIEAIRNKSQGYMVAMTSKEKNQKGWDKNPWVAYFHEMAAKTMIRRLSKMLPMAIERLGVGLQEAAIIDGASESGILDVAAFSETVNDETLANAIIDADVAEEVSPENEEKVKRTRTPKQPKAIEHIESIPFDMNMGDSPDVVSAQEQARADVDNIIPGLRFGE